MDCEHGSNVSLAVLDKLIFLKKKLIIDGAVKVESLLITDNMSSKVVSFFKESSRLKRLHIDGTVNVDITIRDNHVHLLHWGKNTIIFLLQGAGASSAVRPPGRSCSIIQQFNNSTIQPFKNSTIQHFNNSTLPNFHTSANQHFKTSPI